MVDLPEISTVFPNTPLLVLHLQFVAKETNLSTIMSIGCCIMALNLQPAAAIPPPIPPIPPYYSNWQQEQKQDHQQ